jgi:hypothetical protein
MSQGRSVARRGQSEQNEPQIEIVRCIKSSLGCTHLQFDIMRVAVFAENRRFSASC